MGFEEGAGLGGGDPPGRRTHLPRRVHGLLERGIALAPSAYEVGFLSVAHTPEHIDRLATALGEVLDSLDSESLSTDQAGDEHEGSES